MDNSVKSQLRPITVNLHMFDCAWRYSGDSCREEPFTSYLCLDTGEVFEVPSMDFSYYLSEVEMAANRNRAKNERCVEIPGGHPGISDEYGYSENDQPEFNSFQGTHSIHIEWC